MRRTLPVLLLTLLFVASSAAQTFKVFHSFSFTDGSSPNGDLLRDSAGNFYGTTQFGGSSNRGIVFELDDKGNETILYTFTGGSRRRNSHRSRNSRQRRQSLRDHIARRRSHLRLWNRLQTD